MKKKVIEINNYKWLVKFVNVNELPEKTDGITMYNENQILIRDDLNDIVTEHVLCVQGRWFVDNFTQEEVCEFIGFQLPIINKLVKKILNK